MPKKLVSGGFAPLSAMVAIFFNRLEKLDLTLHATTTSIPLSILYFRWQSQYQQQNPRTSTTSTNKWKHQRLSIICH